MAIVRAVCSLDRFANTRWFGAGNEPKGTLGSDHIGLSLGLIEIFGGQLLPVLEPLLDHVSRQPWPNHQHSQGL